MRYRFKRKYENRSKFFKEKTSNAHLDARYGKTLTHDEVKSELFRLLNRFTVLCKKRGIKPVLFHGGLIGYYFNKKLLPWDVDLDLVLVDESIMNINALHGYNRNSILIEVNPESVNRAPGERSNVIDARVISKKNGVFIDITFLTRSRNGNLHCKSPHYYRPGDIKPLRKTLFEGCEIFVPNDIKSCLRSEYGVKVFIPKFYNWVFDGNEWIRKTR